MDNILDYLSRCFGNDDATKYPGLFKKRGQTENFKIALMQTNYLAFGDTPSELRSYDWKNI